MYNIFFIPAKKINNAANVHEIINYPQIDEKILFQRKYRDCFESSNVRFLV